MTIRRIIGLIVGVIAVAYMIRQVRKPTRWVGRLFLWGMNRSHSSLTDWGLEHVRVEPSQTILDVGCGGGRTVQKMAAIATSGIVHGVDYSVGSVAASRALNAKGIDAGRVEIRLASVSQLPFPDRTFDLVTAAETHYYWPDLPRDAREILRVMKPGGTLIVIAESYKGSRSDALQGMAMRALGAAHMSLDEHRDWLAAAGFADVQVYEERNRGWMCVVGKRPTDGAPGRTSA